MKYSLRETKLNIPNRLKSYHAASISLLRNLVAGLLDAQGYLLQIGILQNLDADSCSIYSRRAENVRDVELGNVKLSPSGVELGYLE